MATQNQQRFHPRFIINDHFDNVINKIDIKTETLLTNQSSTEEKRNELNEIRDKQIEKIKEIQQINLKYLSSNIDETEYEEKWSHILQNNSLDYQQKIDQIKDKENLIHFDCILLKKMKKFANLNKKFAFKLWITPWFYNQKYLEFLR